MYEKANIVSDCTILKKGIEVVLLTDFYDDNSMVEVRVVGGTRATYLVEKEYLSIIPDDDRWHG